GGLPLTPRQFAGRREGAVAGCRDRVRVTPHCVAVTRRALRVLLPLPPQVARADRDLALLPPLGVPRRLGLAWLEQVFRDVQPPPRPQDLLAARPDRDSAPPPP